jgi:CheY-like chemotaxis protein
MSQRGFEDEAPTAPGVRPSGVAEEIDDPLTCLMLDLEHVLRMLRVAAASDDPSASLAETDLALYMRPLERALEAANRVRQIVRSLQTSSHGDVEHPGTVDVRRGLESVILPARRRVLVIDSEPLVRESIAEVLATDVDVTTAGDAREGLRRILSEDRAFDLVLCDLMMPEMTGMELYLEVVRAAPAIASRIIFMTGGVFTPRAKAFLENLGNPCLEKPLRMDKLRSLLSRAGW